MVKGDEHEMTNDIRHLLIAGGRFAAGVTAAALLATACSSSTKSGTPPATAGTGAANGGAAVVATHSGSLGTYLTDSSGRTLYDFVSDTSTKSTCSGACLTFWPPLTTTGAPTATGDAKSSLLGTITGSDGSKQVTYNGHPLYYFKLDTKVGDTKGQGSTNFGAPWWLVSPAGASITK